MRLPVRFPAARLLPLRFMAALAAVLPLPAMAASPFPGWLAGSWQMEDGAAWADMIWTSARGEEMLGLDRNGFGPELESWKSLRIVRKPGGTLALVEQLRGGPAAEWPLALAGPDSVEFASTSPAAKPQRIRFWREGQLLMVESSKLDGSEAERLNYRPVETAPRD